MVNKTKTIDELDMELAELIVISSWWQQNIHTDLKLPNNHNIGQTKELENAPVLLCRNIIIHIIHKQNKT